MNVLHIVVTGKLSGAEKVALLICKNIKENINSTIICGGDELRDYYIKHDINSYNIDFSQNIIKIVNQLSRLIEENEVDIIHAHDNKASLYAYLAKITRHRDVKLISHVHNCYDWLNKKSFYKIIDRTLRNKYDLNLMCGKVVYDYYLENASYIKKNKAITISNFIDVEEIKEKTNYSLKKENSEFKFGFVGRLCKQKGIIPFIKKLSEHKELFCDSKFIFIGTGEDEENIKDLVKYHNIENLIDLKGYQSNPYKYYNEFDVFFLPSLYEGLPMVILESMVSKIPIVSMNVGSISEVINKDTGILVPKGNYDEFIKSLLKIKNNKDLRDTLSKNAHEHITKNYDAKKEVLKIEKIYKDLINI